MKHRCGCRPLSLSPLLVMLLFLARPNQAFPKRQENPFQGRKRVILHESQNLEVVMNFSPFNDRNETVVTSEKTIADIPPIGTWLLKFHLVFGAFLSVLLFMHPLLVGQCLLRKEVYEVHRQEDALLEKLMVRLVAVQHAYLLVALQKVPERQALAMITIFWGLTIALIFGSLASSLESVPIMGSGLVLMLIFLSMWTLIPVVSGRVVEP